MLPVCRLELSLDACKKADCLLTPSYLTYLFFRLPRGRHHPRRPGPVLHAVPQTIFSIPVARGAPGAATCPCIWQHIQSIPLRYPWHKGRGRSSERQTNPPLSRPGQTCISFPLYAVPPLIFSPPARRRNPPCLAAALFDVTIRNLFSPSRRSRIVTHLHKTLPSVSSLRRRGRMTEIHRTWSLHCACRTAPPSIFQSPARRSRNWPATAPFRTSSARFSSTTALTVHFRMAEVQQNGVPPNW